jgi:pyruvate formate lyase activating enzyme
MRIAGLQRVSTIDYPGEVACIIFLHGCNFRCGFCYNPDLVVGKGEGGFSEEDVLSFLRKRVGKLDGVCITGGEPLMSLDFDFVRKIKDLGFKVKVDTNGSFPDRLKEMIDEGLVDYVAMDIKGAREKYCDVVNVDVDLSKIEESIRIVNDFVESEFRTTVVGRLHSKNDVVEMARWMNEVCGVKPERFFLQGFKSGQEMIDSSFGSEVDISENILLEMKDSLSGYFGEVDIRV